MKKKLYLALAAMTLLASCQKNEEQTGDRVAARFADATITRATGSTWEAGDAIGVYMVAEGNSPINAIDGAKNIRHTVAAAGTTVAFTPTAQTIYFPGGGKKVDFHAYYPHQAEIVDCIYKVDVSNQANPAAIDLMTASALGKDESTPNVPFAFTHALAKLSLTLAPGRGLTLADLAGMTVTIKGTHATADYNIYLKMITNRVVANFPAKTTAAGTAAEAILIPTVFNSGDIKVAFHLAGGIEHEWILPTPATGVSQLEPGKDYRHTLTIHRTGATLVSQNISDWMDGNGPGGQPGTVEDILVPCYSVGDYFPDPDVTFSAPGIVSGGIAPVGIVYWLDETAPGYVAAVDGKPAQGFKGKIVSLDETASIVWGPEGVATGAIDQDNGLPNMVTIKAIPGWGTAYLPFKWCADRTIGGRTWYLPAVRELGWLSREFLKNMSAFNNKLTAAGGTALRKTSYWSSSELETEKDPKSEWAYIASFSEGGGLSGLRKENENPVRAISAF